MGRPGRAADDDRLVGRSTVGDCDDEKAGERETNRPRKKIINIYFYCREDLDQLLVYMLDDWEGKWEDNLHLWNKWTGVDCSVSEDCWYCLLNAVENC